MCHDINLISSLKCSLEADSDGLLSPADVPNAATFQIGYFEPPNNVKRWIVEEKDLK